MARKKIQVLAPFVQPGYDDVSRLQEFISNDIELVGSIIDFGPSWLESSAQNGLAIPGTMAKIIQAEKEGMDAVVINCMSDTAVSHARTCVSIPVLGPCETSLNLACQLGFRYSIITMVDEVINDLRNRASLLGLGEKLASVCSIQMPCEEMLAHPEERNRRLVEKAKQVVEKDGADVIVFGCTEMAGAGAPVRASLLQSGIDVPVIDPIPATVQMASMLLDLNLSHSKHAYPSPGKLDFAGLQKPAF